jgi:hypothetical protein
MRLVEADLCGVPAAHARAVGCKIRLNDDSPSTW